LCKGQGAWGFDQCVFASFAALVLRPLIISGAKLSQSKHKNLYFLREISTTTLLGLCHWSEQRFEKISENSNYLMSSKSATNGVECKDTALADVQMVKGEKGGSFELGTWV
jgi:hypothetical protein